MSLQIKINGQSVPFTEFHHEHGRHYDLFAEIDVSLKGGDDLAYEGELPEGKTELWVRFPYADWKGEPLGHGNIRLSQRAGRLRKTSPASGTE